MWLVCTISRYNYNFPKLFHFTSNSENMYYCKYKNIAIFNFPSTCWYYEIRKNYKIAPAISASAD